MANSSSNSDINLLSIYNRVFRYKGYVFQTGLTDLEILQKCERFEFRNEDIVIATYPRSGTTLTIEIVWQIVNHDKLDECEKADFSFMEYNLKARDENNTNPIDSLTAQSGRRFIKTHLPYSFIRDQLDPVRPKTIVVMRNAKDNVVSCYSFFLGVQFLKEEVPLGDYLKAYMAGETVYGDYRDFNLEYWSLRDQDHILMVRYEDLIHQPFQEVRKMALFLGYSLSAEKITEIVNNTTFATMSKKDTVNYTLASGNHKMMRKGKTGDWKTKLTVAQSAAMDGWIAERLNSAGLLFTYE